MPGAGGGRGAGEQPGACILLLEDAWCWDASPAIAVLRLCPFPPCRRSEHGVVFQINAGEL